MAAVKRGRRNPNQVEIVKEKEGEEGFVDEKPTSTGVSEVASSSSSESNVARLRERWELASVLNFLHVFKPLIELKTELSAEEIEQGLITPNNVLSQLHIALLKGIPPVNKNLSGPDAWMAILLKKLAPWWPWVAEGEIPLAAGQGEVSRYKELDPLTRLLVLKALCEIRAFQDDIVTHINDALKEGTPISNFRKDRMGGGRNGTSYWYDADESIGHRLYREVAKVDCTPKSKGKGRLSQPRISYEWETIATNLEEFQQISVKLSSSKAGEESAVSQMIVDDIIPELEKIQKKKERAFKRQQRQEILLSGVFNSFQTEGIRSCRSRKPVSYTFDEYDRSINEGLQLLTKKRKTTRERSQEKKEVANGRMNGGAAKDSSQNSDDNEKDDGSSGSDDTMDTDVDHDKLKGTGGGSDSDDADFDDKNDENDSKSDDDDDDTASEESASSGSENKTRGSRTRLSKEHKGRFVKNGAGLRRSTRLTGNASDSDTDGRHHADTKKMLRQRPTRNSDYRPGSASDSEDTKSSEKTSSEASGSENESKDVLKGLLEENEENTESENTENEEENAEDEEESTENKKENAESEEEGAENEKENAESEEEESTENKKEAESEEEGTENEKENAESEEAGTENEKENTESEEENSDA